MDNRIHEAFGAIRAEEGLKARTRARLREKLDRRSPRRRLAPVLACGLALVLAMGGAGMFFTPTSAISIDVNPSLELEVNAFDRVIAVETYNAESAALTDGLSLRFCHYADAVEQVLDALAQGDYLAGEDDLLSVAVAGDNLSQTQRILSTVESCTAGRGNVQCRQASAQAAQQAGQLGMSCGKYLAYLDLLQADPQITPQEVQQMSMAEIRSRLAALDEDGEGTNGQHGQGYGHGQGNGPGYGQGQYGQGHGNQQ